jgi:hypothetical protein
MYGYDAECDLKKLFGEYYFHSQTKKKEKKQRD